MPTRPRSQQLEDISINYFGSLLPSAWVMRQKDKDYGVDLEVEIFNEDGLATGLMFFVQMRATDNPEKSRKLSLKVEQFEYFRSLELPTIVVRFCSIENTIFWQWHFVIMSATSLNEEQKTFTYTFSENERWISESANNIRQTLEIGRAIKSCPPTARIKLRQDLSRLASNDRFIIDRVVYDICDSISCLSTSSGDSRNAFIVDVEAGPNYLRVRIDRWASRTIPVEHYEAETTSTTLLYLLSALLYRIRFLHQANSISREIITRGVAHENKSIALAACFALAPDLPSSVELAILNGLHKEHDELHLLFSDFLFKSDSEKEARRSAILRFYQQAAECARLVSPNREAMVCYSMGNIYRFHGDYVNAVQAFNRARRLRHKYLNADYFLGELGACMFNRGHYRCAAELYRRSLEINPTAKGALQLADALFFSGDAGEAINYYDAALEGDNKLINSEAWLKKILCNRIIEIVGSSKIPISRKNARLLLPDNLDPDPELWWKIISTVDALDGFAHYNLAIWYAKNQMHDKALSGFLLCAFKTCSDVDAWVEAIIAAFHLEGIDVLTQVLAVALSLAGQEAYDRLRQKLLQQSTEESLVEMFDEMWRQLMPLVEKHNVQEVTHRFLRD